MFKTTATNLAGGKPTTRHRRFPRFVPVGMVLVALLSVVWVRGELLAINEIDLVVDYHVPEWLPVEENRKPRALLEQRLSDERGRIRGAYIQRLRDQYRISFVEGFDECRDLFLGLDSKISWYVDKSVPADPYFDPRRLRRKSNLKWVFAAHNSEKAEQDGNAACLQQLKAWSDRFGVRRVRRVLLWKYGSSADGTACYVDDTLHGIWSSVPVLIAATFILAAVKLANRAAWRMNDPTDRAVRSPV